jgi:hypothetical protein
MPIALALASLLLAQAAPLRFVPGPGSPLAIGGSPGAIECADLNRDGKLDLVLANGRNGVVVLLLGDGRGGFTPAPGSPLSVASPLHLLAVGDLDGDQRLDLAATSHDSHDVFVWKGDGTGRFAAAPGSPFPALSGGKPHNHGLALGDVDRDGDLDVVTADDVAHVVAVLLNDGKGRFAPSPRSPFAVGREPYPLALGDLNSDGRLDVVTPNVGGAGLSVLLGDGRGAFEPTASGPISVTARPYFVTLGDLNGDGALDALVTHDDVSLVTAVLGDGKGSAPARPRLAVRHRPAPLEGRARRPRRRRPAGPGAGGRRRRGSPARRRPRPVLACARLTVPGGPRRLEPRARRLRRRREGRRRDGRSRGRNGDGPAAALTAEGAR